MLSQHSREMHEFGFTFGQWRRHRDGCYSAGDSEDEGGIVVGCSAVVTRTTTKKSTARYRWQADSFSAAEGGVTRVVVRVTATQSPSAHRAWVGMSSGAGHRSPCFALCPALASSTADGGCMWYSMWYSILQSPDTRHPYVPETRLVSYTPSHRPTYGIMRYGSRAPRPCASPHAPSLWPRGTRQCPRHSMLRSRSTPPCSIQDPRRS